MASAEMLTWTRNRLASLPDVATKREFGNETFLVGGARFAALTGRALVARLPPTELIGALRSGIARPFVSVGAMGRNGWVEVKLEGVDQTTLERLIESAHSSAQHAHRRSPLKRPSAARRSRAKT